MAYYNSYFKIQEYTFQILSFCPIQLNQLHFHIFIKHYHFVLTKQKRDHSF
jgi:hypothetical protein